MHFYKKFKQALRETNSHLIVGLDTDVTQIPKFFLSSANPIGEFNSLVIEATKDYVCGYKPNIAFYERAEELGLSALRAMVPLIPEKLITIADAKRGDLENTTEQYAKAYLDQYGFDSITVQPYMGQDAVRPFLRRKNKFVWMLALTSNYGANDFQFQLINKKPLWEVVVEKAYSWNEQKIGFVFGANHVKELAKMTKKYPEVPILIPGIGAQKNSLERTIGALNHGLFVINQSRSIIYSAPKAENAADFMQIVGENAMKARDEINGFLQMKK